jgi:NAD(P)-dependent dehydrogenase (short-subunit alcohol dehydrogenase family)
MDDVLRYAGKRVIVTGAASGVGAAVTKILVDLGAEVHTLDRRKPDVSGLASFTETDLRDREQIDAAVNRVGAIVDALFNCAVLPGDMMRHLTERVVPNMIDGSAIVHVSAPENAGDVEVVRGMRVNYVVAAPDVAPERQAWPLVFLNSPRAASVNGAALRV